MSLLRASLLLVVLSAAGCQLVPSVAPGPTSCDDGRVNGEETDVDCGGSSCAGCAAGKICLGDGDCESRVCADSHCAVATCADAVENGDESDVDCGGSCAPCADRKACRGPADCASGNCASNVCGGTSCSDLAKNGDETDVDCGGSCPPCVAGKQCVRTADCAAGACVDGTCGGALACAPPLLDCSGACVDARFDHEHCGGCTPCNADEVCFDGMCFPSCTGGLVPCPSGCVDLGSNRANCGMCGRSCNPGEVCAAGNCVFACPQGQTDCGGTCVSTDRDQDHCGNCMTQCPQGTACLGGMCTTACPAPLLLCSGGAACVDPQNDPSNCGGCGNLCTPVANAVPSCAGGMCGAGACLPGFDDCDGQDVNGCEVDLTTAQADCGTCGRACGGSEMCLGGRCCGALPAGTYQTTCDFCEACDGVLSCICRDAAQNPTPTSIPLTPPCPLGYTNCNGVLLCNGC